jgi:hypothetical protein
VQSATKARRSVLFIIRSLYASPGLASAGSSQGRTYAPESQSYIGLCQEGLKRLVALQLPKWTFVVLSSS